MKKSESKSCVKTQHNTWFNVSLNIKEILYSNHWSVHRAVNQEVLSFLVISDIVYTLLKEDSKEEQVSL